MKVRSFLLISAILLGTICSVAGATNNNPNTIMDAYYDGQLFTINFMELPPDAEQATLAHNTGLNNIYQSDACVDGGFQFISIIDAIPTDGMNPLWQEVQINFTSGHPCRQLLSDDDVSAAVASGEITLTPTGEIYRCSVIKGPH